MKPLDLPLVNAYVEQHIGGFHDKRLKSPAELTLSSLLRKKNPYLFRAKNLLVASDLVTELLGAFLSSSEEKLFGDFLEDLAIFVAIQTADGHKSTAPGIDLEFADAGVQYVVSIKSGPNWGNSSQQKKQEDDFKKAVIRLKQSSHTANVQPVLGICYGRTRTTFLRGYMKVTGQSFWQMISGDADLYKKIIVPVGYRAKDHNERFSEGRSLIVNRFTHEFISQFCDVYGAIDWDRLIAFNSQNMDQLRSSGL
ncbi:MAG: cytosolic protein [Anaerolineae bacterium]|nr:cytosolic protein [Anaerolineae bacterium]